MKFFGQIAERGWPFAVFDPAVEAVMAKADELRERAARYRQLAENITDKPALEALHELAEKYEALAAALGAGDQSTSEEV